jgi:hypothetical protein
MEERTVETTTTTVVPTSLVPNTENRDVVPSENVERLEMNVDTKVEKEEVPNDEEDVADDDGEEGEKPAGMIFKSNAESFNHSSIIGPTRRGRAVRITRSASGLAFKGCAFHN